MHNCAPGMGASVPLGHVSSPPISQVLEVGHTYKTRNRAEGNGTEPEVIVVQYGCGRWTHGPEICVNYSSTWYEL